MVCVIWSGCFGGIRVCSSRKRRGPWRQARLGGNACLCVVYEEASSISTGSRCGSLGTNRMVCACCFPRATQRSGLVLPVLSWFRCRLALSDTQLPRKQRPRCRCTLPESAASLPLHPDSHVSCAATWSLRSDGSWASVGITGLVGWRLLVGWCEWRDGTARVTTPTEQLVGACATF